MSQNAYQVAAERGYGTDSHAALRAAQEMFYEGWTPAGYDDCGFQCYDPPARGRIFDD